MANPRAVVEAIKELRFERTFNPYSDHCVKYDVKGSANLRAEILLNILEEAEQLSIDAIWIGRDLGHRGGRRTGLALTDDLSFEKHLARWRLDNPKPTSSYVKEQTATAIWEMLEYIPDPIFLWNVFPLHPFPNGNQFANRTHTATERKSGEKILQLICELLNPNRIIAIGNDAANCATKMWSENKVYKVRHPSYGGKRDFFNGIQSLYGFEIENAQSSLFPT